MHTADINLITKTNIWDDTLLSKHAHARLQSWDIKLGTFLYSDCKSYSEFVIVRVVTRAFKPHSSKNKLTLSINYS